MDFWIAIGRLARSPRVILPTALLAASLMAATLLLVPPTYVASSTMVLTSTEFGGTVSRDPEAPAELVNPMLVFNESLRTSADMLIWSMSSKDVQEEFERDGGVTLTVDDGRTNPELLSFTGPIVYVSARSSDPTSAEAAVVRARSMMRDRLVGWQKQMKAPSATYVSMVEVVPPTEAVADAGRRMKLATLALAIGLVTGLSVAYGWMRLTARRLARPTRPSGPRPAPASTPDDRSTSSDPAAKGRQELKPPAVAGSR